MLAPALRRLARRAVSGWLVFALALAFLTADVHASSTFDPALRFRMMRTEHFIIYFHQGEERLANRLASIAEDTWRALQRPFGLTPPRLTHVVLADQTEFANGYATPLPYDTVVIYTVVPSGFEFDFDNWLQLVFTHEFTHIIHLDRSEGWARAVRSVFGRTILGFPNMFLPLWQIEGLATYEESVITGEGRLHAGDFRAIVDEAARERALEPLDRVNGGLTDWPGGTSVYAYGAGFHQYLADRFGADRLAALADATARSLPYTGSRAFERIYGQPLGALWREYEATLSAALPPVPADANLTRLTHQGFDVSGPRFDRFVCQGCPPEILYSAINPHGFPALYRIDLNGSQPKRITTRYTGSTTAIGRDEVYFDQLEFRRNAGVYSDLYAWSRSSGRVRQVSRDARLLDPDLAPDGRVFACVRNAAGQRDLVLVSLAGAVTTLVAETDTQFDAPKWSPDGRTIVVERHRLGALSEIVLVDVEAKSVRVLASGSGTRYVMPTWRPDGGAVVAAFAAGEETFNLVEIAVDGSATRQLTRTTGGATWPDISPDGRTIVFVGYTKEGRDLFSMPYPPDAVNAGAGITPGGPANDAGHREASGAGAVDSLLRPTAGYSPLPTLAPTSWTPVVETGGGQVRVGAGTAGSDVLGYHTYVATATWLAASPTGALRPNAAVPDWQLYYAYNRWRPSFYVAASSDTTFFAGAATEENTPTQATRRALQLEGGIVFPIAHVRVQHTGLLSIGRAMDDYTLSDGSISRERTPVRAAWQTITSHTYGYSISREEGIAAGVTAEFVRQALGSSADATTVTGDVRAYLPALAQHHVLALRAAAGSSVGDPDAGRTFLLGGSFPGGGVADFDSRAISLLRGFADNTFAGSHVALMNIEYRWPIARPQRGVGTWPLFLHTIHAAIFADAGQAWTRAFRSDAVKTSAGAEVSVDVVAGYTLPFTFAIGAAWGHDGSGIVAGRTTGYVRVGKSF